MLSLNQIHHIPAALLEIKNSTEIHTVFDQPTLLFLEGKHKNPLFVSVLLHANEDTGFLAIQQLLKKYSQPQHPLPRSLIIFFGNIKASKEGVRRLKGQPDYNRVWPGGDYPECEETRITAVSTGYNPHFFNWQRCSHAPWYFLKHPKACNPWRWQNIARQSHWNAVNPTSRTVSNTPQITSKPCCTWKT